MGLLAHALRPSGPTHDSPPIPLCHVQETWYPWYQTLSRGEDHCCGLSKGLELWRWLRPLGYVDAQIF
jgi:hypothetical protein